MGDKYSVPLIPESKTMSSKIFSRLHRLASAIVVGLTAACATPADTKPSTSAAAIQHQAIERLGRELVSTDRADGLSVAIIENGNVRFFNFGTASRTTVRPPTENTVYEIGSITKVFSSLLLAHAVAEGRVQLQDDIRKYLPGAYPRLEFNGSPVRLVHLAEMTSALPDNIPDLAPFIQQGGMDRAPFLIAERWKTYSNAELLAALRDVVPIDQPGNTRRHSNVAATLLGIILETVYNEPYEALIARYVEKPFGMGPGTSDARLPQLASGYNSRHSPMPAIDARYILTAGGLRYSSADMARFVLAQTRATDAAIRLSQQPTTGNGMDAAGFNWWISTDAQGRRILRTSGGTFGFSSYVEVRPDWQYGIVALANRAGAETALREFAGQVFKNTAADNRTPNLPPITR